MKTCSKCGESKSDSDFYDKRKICKKCILTDPAYIEAYKLRNEKRKQWRKEHPDEAKINDKTHHEKYKESSKITRKKYYEKNRAKIISQTKEYVENHHNERIEYWKNYRVENKEIIAKKDKLRFSHPEKREKRILKSVKFRELNPDYYNINKDRILKQGREYSKTPKGRVNDHKKQAKRRNLGHNPLNDFFMDSEEHHLRYSNSAEDKDNDMTIYVPKELHKSIRHNGTTGKNMREINIACLEWYFANTPVENRNKKAVDLYLKYCMLPEPSWESEQIST